MKQIQCAPWAVDTCKESEAEAIAVDHPCHAWKRAWELHQWGSGAFKWLWTRTESNRICWFYHNYSIYIIYIYNYIYIFHIMTNIIKSTDARACYLMSVSKCSDWEQFRQGLPMIPMTLPQKELKSLHHFHPQMHFPQRAGSGSLWYVEVWAPMCMHIRHEMLNSLEQDSQSAVRIEWTQFLLPCPARLPN